MRRSRHADGGDRGAMTADARAQETGSRSDDRFGELLHQLASGERSALREIVPLVYTALRQIARRHLARERPGHTLDSIALVNEAFLNFAAQDKLVLEN